MTDSRHRPAERVEKMSQLAWHFLTADCKLRDGREVVVGKWLTHDGPLAFCVAGLHASARAIDAIEYATGPIACLVEVGGRIRHAADKLVCSRRRVLAMLDATELLQLFARICALDVIHLWDAPAIVREYLETGDDNLRAASRATWDASWAAWDAARAASRAAQNVILESLLLSEMIAQGFDANVLRSR